MKAEIVTEKKFLCPNCKDHGFKFGHLLKTPPGASNNKYTWTCEVCVSKVSFIFEKSDESVCILEVKKPPEGKKRLLILLQLDTANRPPFYDEEEEGSLEITGTSSEGSPVFVVVTTDNYDHEDNLEEISKHKEFHFNVHTCPTNFLGVTAIIEGEDHDPHGIFRFRQAIWEPEGFDDCDFENDGGRWSDLFSCLRNGS